jgi:hypothetical protein
MSGRGFTEAELLAAAWSKQQKVNDTANLRSDRRSKSFLHRDESDRHRHKSRRTERRSYSRSRSREKRKKKERKENRSSRDIPSYSPYRGNPNDGGRTSPTYSPYRGDRPAEEENYHMRRSPRSRSGSRSGNLSRSRSRDRRYRSRSRPRSRSRSADSAIDPALLAKMPPPSDPMRPDHDDRSMRKGHNGGRRHLDRSTDLVERRERSERRNRSRSRSREKKYNKSRSRSRSGGGRSSRSSSSEGVARGPASQWMHDKYMRAVERARSVHHDANASDNDTCTNL